MAVAAMPGRGGGTTTFSEGQAPRMLGELYEQALTGTAVAQIEHADGRLSPLPVQHWLHATPGDESMLDRCDVPTLDVARSSPSACTPRCGRPSPSGPGWCSGSVRAGPCR